MQTDTPAPRTARLMRAEQYQQAARAHITEALTAGDAARLAQALRVEALWERLADEARRRATALSRLA